MNPKNLTVNERVKLLVEALDGAEKTNEALSNAEDVEAMVAVLLEASQKLGLALTRDELMKTPPIRDWIWYKSGGALVTVGDGIPRYQQDKFSGNLLYIGGGLVIALLFIFGILTGF
ncbi:hypothetical protein [Prochlorococcus sp. MIT 1300]|uniref:hypothetical protein n=1 Tax=Prochlorococcus sp. MIT 1300 TaxID=3096218 RepID=UPI002A74E05C|nr:hypothetical protein [Prochlorococcus sp. MIT 1300]